jgi:hypothetical protein
MNNTGSPVLSGVGQAIITTNSNVTPRDGGPLSYFLTSVDPDPDPDPDSITTTNTTLPAPTKPELLSIKDPETQVEPDANVINHVITQNASLSSIDWDSDENWERRVIRFVMDDKRWRQQQFELIENEKQKLEEEKQQIGQMKQSIEQRENNLKARESKIAEVEPLIPSIRQMQSVGITFELIMPYLPTINEKSALENVDLKTAAYNIVHDFREYRNLGSMSRAIENAEQKLSALSTFTTQKEQAINALANLQVMGYTEKDIAELTGMVNVWNKSGIGLSHNNGGKKLDTELIGVRH